jgi:SAM-dependent methyltransferase
MKARNEDLPLFAPVFHRQTQGFTVAATSPESVEEEHPNMATAIQTLPRSAKKRTEPVSHYTPMASVWYGEDAELLERMLDFYPRKTPRKILDATVNGGRFWRNSKRPVTGMDIDQCHKPDILADNTNMPLEDATFDVIVYDPPHIPNQGRDNKKDFNTRFGLVLRSSKENHYTFTHTFPPFLREAYRVLKIEGILLCKITDYVHHHRYQWAHIELINAACEVGFMPCDCIVKIRKGPIIDPKWKTAHHTRRQHCYWLVFRKSKKCE